MLELTARDVSPKNLQESLVSITPWVVLHADVLEWVLGTLLNWGQMLLMLPMLVPEVVGVETSESDTWDDEATKSFEISELSKEPAVDCSLLAREGCGDNILDGEFSPEL